MSEFYQNPYQAANKTTDKHIKKIVGFFCSNVSKNAIILDIGDNNPLADRLRELGYRVHNTDGDLDIDFEFELLDYDVILYSHTIEHQFNPLYTLLRLKPYVNLMYIATPDRGKLLWCKNHFHEIDSYRMKKLVERAGLKIIEIYRYKHWRYWKEYFKIGIRPILRLIFERYAIYTVIQDEKE